MKKFIKWFKRQKWYIKILVVLTFPIIGVVLGFLYINKKKTKETVIYNKDDFVKVEKNEDETQKLPETPDLDKTLNDMGEHMNE